MEFCILPFYALSRRNFSFWHVYIIFPISNTSVECWGFFQPIDNFLQNLEQIELDVYIQTSILTKVSLIIRSQGKSSQLKNIYQTFKSRNEKIHYSLIKYHDTKINDKFMKIRDTRDYILIIIKGLLRNQSERLSGDR